MAEQQVDAFACEAAWRVERTIPTLRQYLRVGQQSIGVEWTAATLIALDPDARVPRAGSVLSSTVASIARAIRLANDLHDPERERGEGKVQWLLLRAQQIVATGLADESAEHQAGVELRAAAAGEAASARALLRGPSRHHLGGTDALRAGLEGLLGVGLAVYVPDLAMAA